jgi:predicted MPP superfamily phosphohydrolase
MLRWRHYFFDLIIAGICLAMLFALFRWTRDLGSRYRLAARVLIVAAVLIITSTAGMAPRRIGDRFSNGFIVTARVAGITTVAFVMYFFVLAGALRRVPAHTPGRRNVLRVAGAAMVALPVAVASAAFIQRDKIRLVEVDLPIPGLPPDLNGLRIVQVTDIHLSPLVDESLLARAVDMANEARASIAIVTGDLVTRVGDPLDACLRQLGRIRSDAGTFGCLGNHEIYAGAEAYTVLNGRKLGMQFLRSEARALRFGDAVLNVAGVDYQQLRQRYLVGTEKLIVPGATNLLLSHNPDVFRVAAAQGFDITLAGHTHGGQVSFEMIHPSLNIAHFYTPFIHGVYEEGRSRLFVSRGVGTIGVPARLGAPPEVAVLRLCAISS